MYRLQGLVPMVSFYFSKTPFFKWLWRKMSWRWLIKARIHSNYMYLDALDPGISTNLLVEGTREPGHVAQVKGNLKTGMCGIDIGANIGYYVLIEAKQIGEKGRIYAIEPEPENIELLKKNIIANGFENQVSVFQYLVGDRDEMSSLRLSAFSNRHSVSEANRYKIPGSEKAPVIPVPMIRLDSFMEQKNLRPEDVNFLRMDVEGYEVVIFQGMNKLLNAKTPLKIFIELHPKWYGEWGWTLEKFIDQLSAHGLKVKSLSFKREGGIQTVEDPTREQVLATENSPYTINGGSHAYLERI